MWTLIIVLLGLVQMFYWWPRRHILKAASHIPGPMALPLVGNLLAIDKHPEKVFTWLLQTMKKYGTVTRIWAGPKLYVVLTDPVDAQTVLGNSRAKNKDIWMTSAMATFLGNGLLTSRGDQWKVHRRLITPAFSSKILKTYVEIFGRRADCLLQQLEVLADGQTFDIHNLINNLTADTICETVLGTSVRVRKNMGRDLYEQLQIGGELVMRRVIFPWLLSDWLYELCDDGKKARQIKEMLKGFSQSVISDKLDAFHRTKSSKNQEEVGSNSVKTFLDVVVESSECEGSLMTPQEISDEVTTLAVAAVETTSTITSAFFTLMGIHPEIQDKVVAQLDEIFGDDLRHPTFEDLTNMTVLERCIKEALRLFPVGPFLAREIDRDTNITRGFVLPRGSVAVVFNYGIHHDSRNYPDPELFLPDRWLPENSEGRHPYAYLPFSAGQRNCIGQKYAMLQMKTTVSSVLRKFTVSTNTSLKELQVLKAGTAVQSVVGYHIQVAKRTKKHNEGKSVVVTKL